MQSNPILSSFCFPEAAIGIASKESWLISSSRLKSQELQFFWNVQRPWQCASLQLPHHKHHKLQGFSRVIPFLLRWNWRFSSLMEFALPSGKNHVLAGLFTGSTLSSWNSAPHQINQKVYCRLVPLAAARPSLSFQKALQEQTHHAPGRAKKVCYKAGNFASIRDLVKDVPRSLANISAKDTLILEAWMIQNSTPTLWLQLISCCF